MYDGLRSTYRGRAIEAVGSNQSSHHSARRARVLSLRPHTCLRAQNLLELHILLAQDSVQLVGLDAHGVYVRRAKTAVLWKIFFNDLVCDRSFRFLVCSLLGPFWKWSRSHIDGSGVNSFDHGLRWFQQPNAPSHFCHLPLSICHEELPAPRVPKAQEIIVRNVIHRNSGSCSLHIHFVFFLRE